MILVNGVAADSVAATDRGLAYGDGVFRTLLWRRGKPRWWPEQYCRQEAVTPARLLDAREALLVNSVIGVWQIRECAGRSWAPGALVGRVREWLDEDGS
jgi:branched-subunit amino acid aminotransferase/4-amino-4-deoxychorismate lyase